MQPYHVSPGSTVTITCETSLSNQTVTWFHEGEQLKDSARVVTVDEGVKHYLLVHDVTPLDTGNYYANVGDAKFLITQLIVEGTYLTPK